MGKLPLEHIRPCMEGLVPATIATCDAEGIPNVTYVSQVHYVDSSHVGLTFQFFNKTRQNILENPQATLNLIHPHTGAQYRLALLYRHTEQDGALFEGMKAKLAGIASHSGMEQVFRLLGADVYQVLDIEEVQCRPLRVAPPRNLLPALRQAMTELAAASDAHALLQGILSSLASHFAVEHSMLLLVDEAGSKLYTVASHGYPESGVGSEVPLGFGIIGTAAAQRTPIRIAHAPAEYSYAQAIKAFAGVAGKSALETNIPYPGLSDPRSQLAIPLLFRERLLGVLYLESCEETYFTYDDEDALASFAIFAAQRLAEDLLEESSPEQSRVAVKEGGEIVAPRSRGSESDPPATTGPALEVRFYPADGSIFIDQDYLIKGVAGSILWRLLQSYVKEGRQQFSNRELRLDKSLGLPELGDNLEARLILLQRRLQERCPPLSIEKCGRGKFILRIQRPLQLISA